MEGNYTFAELTDMLLRYGAAHGNASVARRLYKERYSNR